MKYLPMNIMLIQQRIDLGDLNHYFGKKIVLIFSIFFLFLKYLILTFLMNLSLTLKLLVFHPIATLIPNIPFFFLHKHLKRSSEGIPFAQKQLDSPSYE